MITLEDIIPFVNVYNEQECLPVLLSSLRRFKTVLVNNGKYPEFEDIDSRPDGLSTDNTEAIARSFDNVVYLESGNKTEEQKKNICLREISKRGAKIAWHFDADEYLVGDLDEFVKNLNQRMQQDPEMHSFFLHIKIIHVTPEGTPYTIIQRIFVDPGFIRLRQVHYVYFFNDRAMELDGVPVEGVTVYHDDTPRTTKREVQMLKYQHKMVPRDNMIMSLQSLKFIEDIKKELTLNDLVTKFPDVNIDSWKNLKGETTYLLTGREITEEESEELNRKYNVSTWKTNKGFNVKRFRFT